MELSLFFPALLLILGGVSFLPASRAWFPAGEGFALFALGALLANAAFIASSRFLPAWRNRLAIGLGILVPLVFANGWDLVIFLAPLLAFALSFLPGRLFSVLLISIGIPAAGYALRRHGLDSFLFWWIFSLWLRFVALGFSRKAADEAPLARLEGYLLFFFAPPFLFGPLSMEWIRYEYFRASEAKPEKLPFKLLLQGTLFLVAHLVLFHPESPLKRFAWSPSRLAAESGWAVHALAGYLFFLSRYLLLAGFTAFAASSFQAAGFRMKYDFNRPFLALNFLDFWSRYHNYARDFLATYLFYPVLLRMPHRLPWWLGASLALVPVFAFVGIVQHLTFVPIPGVEGSKFYSWRGSIQHVFVAFITVFLTLGWDRLVAALTGRLPALSLALRWAFSQLAIGTFFYSGYWNLWMEWPLSGFFARFLGAPWNL